MEGGADVGKAWQERKDRTHRSVGEMAGCSTEVVARMSL